MTLKSSAEWTSERASTNDHFCRQRRRREREHDFCCPHNFIYICKKYFKEEQKKATSSDPTRYACYSY